MSDFAVIKKYNSMILEASKYSGIIKKVESILTNNRSISSEEKNILSKMESVKDDLKLIGLIVDISNTKDIKHNEKITSQLEDIIDEI